MGSLVRVVLVLALLGVPLLVVTELPRVLEIAASIPGPKTNDVFATPTPAFRLGDVTSTPRNRSALNDTLPPTLAPPAATATAVPTPRSAGTGERIMIGNTGGLGAVLRSDPVTGTPIGALRDQQILEVLERRNVPGSGDWVHVRTSDGKEGWVTGLVAVPTSRAQ